MIRTHAQWHQLFQELITSGQDEGAFCATHGIARQYFRLRRRELSGVDAVTPTMAPSAFVPVSVTPGRSSTGALELRHGTAVLTLPVSVAPRWLADLLHALAS
ncbi:MAG: IS66 family insertion sequence element accessory protein TnpA [Acidobacteriaceae bacterium]